MCRRHFADHGTFAGMNRSRCHGSVAHIGTGLLRPLTLVGVWGTGTNGIKEMVLGF